MKKHFEYFKTDFVLYFLGFVSVESFVLGKRLNFMTMSMGFFYSLICLMRTMNYYVLRNSKKKSSCKLINSERVLVT